MTTMESKSRVLVTTPFIQPGDEGDSRLREAGFAIVYNCWHGERTEDEMIDILQGVDGALVSIDPFTRRVFEGADRLKVVSRTGVGYDAVDVRAATDNGVAVCTAVGANNIAVAEFAFLLMMACSRKFKQNLDEVARGGWTRHQERGLEGSTLGIVGMGSIGKEVAKRARAFDMRVIAYDVRPDQEFALQHQVAYVTLEELLRESDFVTLHTFLNDSTHHLIDSESLAIMKPTAYLINSSRGGVVDTAALCGALIEKRIAGAALDVFEQEPLQDDSPLRTMDNVYLTAHVSGSSTKSRHTSMMISTENIIRVLRGDRPPHIVNPEVLKQSV